MRSSDTHPASKTAAPLPPGRFKGFVRDPLQRMIARLHQRHRLPQGLLKPSTDDQTLLERLIINATKRAAHPEPHFELAMFLIARLRNYPQTDHISTLDFSQFAPASAFPSHPLADNLANYIRHALQTAKNLNPKNPVIWNNLGAFLHLTQFIALEAPMLSDTLSADEDGGNAGKGEAEQFDSKETAYPETSLQMVGVEHTVLANAALNLELGYTLANTTQSSDASAGRSRRSRRSRRARRRRGQSALVKITAETSNKTLSHREKTCVCLQINFVECLMTLLESDSAQEQVTLMQNHYPRFQKNSQEPDDETLEYKPFVQTTLDWIRVIAGQHLIHISDPRLNRIAGTAYLKFLLIELKLDVSLHASYFNAQFKHHYTDHKNKQRADTYQLLLRFLDTYVFTFKNSDDFSDPLRPSLILACEIINQKQVKPHLIQPTLAGAKQARQWCLRKLLKHEAGHRQLALDASLQATTMSQKSSAGFRSDVDQAIFLLKLLRNNQLNEFAWLMLGCTLANNPKITETLTLTDTLPDHWRSGVPSDIACAIKGINIAHQTTRDHILASQLNMLLFIIMKNQAMTPEAQTYTIEALQRLFSPWRPGDVELPELPALNAQPDSIQMHFDTWVNYIACVTSYYFQATLLTVFEDNAAALTAFLSDPTQPQIAFPLLQFYWSFLKRSLVRLPNCIRLWEDLADFLTVLPQSVINAVLRTPTKTSLTVWHQLMRNTTPDMFNSDSNSDSDSDSDWLDEQLDELGAEVDKQAAIKYCNLRTGILKHELPTKAVTSQSPEHTADSDDKALHPLIKKHQHPEVVHQFEPHPPAFSGFTTDISRYIVPNYAGQPRRKLAKFAEQTDRRIVTPSDDAQDEIKLFEALHRIAFSNRNLPSVHTLFELALFLQVRLNHGMAPLLVSGIIKCLTNNETKFSPHDHTDIDRIVRYTNSLWLKSKVLNDAILIMAKSRVDQNLIHSAYAAEVAISINMALLVGFHPAGWVLYPKQKRTVLYSQQQQTRVTIEAEVPHNIALYILLGVHLELQTQPEIQVLMRILYSDLLYGNLMSRLETSAVIAAHPSRCTALHATAEHLRSLGHPVTLNSVIKHWSMSNLSTGDRRLTLLNNLSRAVISLRILQNTDKPWDNLKPSVCLEHCTKVQLALKQSLDKVGNRLLIDDMFWGLSYEFLYFGLKWHSTHPCSKIFEAFHQDLAHYLVRTDPTLIRKRQVMISDLMACSLGAWTKTRHGLAHICDSKEVTQSLLALAESDQQTFLALFTTLTNQGIQFLSTSDWDDNTTETLSAQQLEPILRISFILHRLSIFANDPESWLSLANRLIKHRHELTLPQWATDRIARLIDVTPRDHDVCTSVWAMRCAVRALVCWSNRGLATYPKAYWITLATVLHAMPSEHIDLCLSILHEQLTQTPVMQADPQTAHELSQLKSLTDWIEFSWIKGLKQIYAFNKKTLKTKRAIEEIANTLMPEGLDDPQSDTIHPANPLLAQLKLSAYYHLEALKSAPNCSALWSSLANFITLCPKAYVQTVMTDQWWHQVSQLHTRKYLRSHYALNRSHLRTRTAVPAPLPVVYIHASVRTATQDWRLFCCLRGLMLEPDLKTPFTLGLIAKHLYQQVVTRGSENPPYLLRATRELVVSMGVKNIEQAAITVFMRFFNYCEAKYDILFRAKYLGKFIQLLDLFGEQIRPNTLLTEQQPMWRWILEHATNLSAILNETVRDQTSAANTPPISESNWSTETNLLNQFVNRIRCACPADQDRIYDLIALAPNAKVRRVLCKAFVAKLNAYLTAQAREVQLTDRPEPQMNEDGVENGLQETTTEFTVESLLKIIRQIQQEVALDQALPPADRMPGLHYG